VINCVLHGVRPWGLTGGGRDPQLRKAQEVGGCWVWVGFEFVRIDGA